MRAIVLLCLLHAAFGGQTTPFPWNGPGHGTAIPANPDPDQSNVCLLDLASCGCCVMQKKIEDMEWFYEKFLEELNEILNKTKIMFNNVRASRSAFSVALNKAENCYGNSNTDRPIVYEHIFINLGDSYNVQTGIFTVPRSGVYNIAVSVYATSGAGCANLQVNNQTVSQLHEKEGQDNEDSTTLIKAIRLKALDQVAVNLPKGCDICNTKTNKHYNTFTGFLLYAD